MAIDAWAQSIYRIEAPFAPWLWPTLDLAGLALQLFAVLFRYPRLLPVGLIPVGIGCFMERDIVLFAGDIMAVVGLWLYMKE